MKDITSHSFGYLIAYFVPGFISLWGLRFVSPTIDAWLASAESCGELPTIGGFLYMTVTAIGLGMLVSSLRFVLIDRINDYTGLRRPHWDDAALSRHGEAVNALIDHHYRYYQFHANAVVAAVVAYAAHLWSPASAADFTLIEPLLICGLVAFWITARDNLRNYYKGIDQLLTEPGATMSNGRHHPEQKPAKPQTNNAGNQPAKTAQAEAKEKDTASKS